MTKPKIVMLIGAPGSGKSTWTKNFAHYFAAPPVIISSDDLIDAYAAENGLTYTEAFAEIDKKAVENQIRADFREALGNCADIIIDRTNMSVRSRNTWLSQVPKEYERFAVVFQVEDSILQDRLERRKNETGKFIPPHIVASMLASYEAPTMEEFDHLMFVLPEEQLAIA